MIARDFGLDQESEARHRQISRLPEATSAAMGPAHAGSRRLCPVPTSRRRAARDKPRLPPVNATRANGGPRGREWQHLPDRVARVAMPGPQATTPVNATGANVGTRAREWRPDQRRQAAQAAAPCRRDCRTTWPLCPHRDVRADDAKPPWPATCDRHLQDGDRWAPKKASATSECRMTPEVLELI
jgi:hypothetical protein